MNEASIKTCVATGAIVACYCVYACTHPDSDGVVFGTVMTALGAIGGYTVGTVTRTTHIAKEG